MTLLITVPLQSGSLRVVPTGMLPSALETSAHNTTHKNRGRKKSLMCPPVADLYPNNHPVPPCHWHWSVPLRRKSVGLQEYRMYKLNSNVKSHRLGTHLIRH